MGDPAPPPLPRRSEADVVAKWQDGPPLVSVLCPTYQHVGFIEDALRGFLGQDTDFPFEIIVRDDASTDGTADIVRDYAERYPSIVRAVLEPVNTFGQVSPLKDLLRAARGPMLASCEGDDYWIDPRKLSDQVTSLQNGPFVVVGHSSVVIDGGRVNGHMVQIASRSASTRIPGRRLMFGLGAGLHTSTIVWRRMDWPDRLFDRRNANFDVLRDRWFGWNGDALILNQLVGSVYRIHDGGWDSSQAPDERRVRSFTSRYHIARALDDVGATPAAQAVASEAVSMLLLHLRTPPVRTLGGALWRILRFRLIAALRGRRALQAIRRIRWRARSSAPIGWSDPARRAGARKPGS